MKARIFKAPLLAAAVLFLVAGQTFAGTRLVDCDDGDSLQRAIDAGAGSAATVDIDVTGICTEDLLISRDRVTINGDGNTVIEGQVTVRGADNLTIRDLTITGPGNGINASAARIFMVRVHFVGNHDYGIALRHGGAIFLRNGSITNNLGDIGLLIENGHGQLTDVEVSNNALDGIVVNVNGNLTMVGGSVQSQGMGSGVIAKLGSTLELVDVTVKHNLFAGVSVLKSSAAEIHGGFVETNEGAGIDVDENSSLAAYGVEVKDNASTGVRVQRNSNVNIVGGKINDNARVQTGRSGVFVSTSSSADIDGTEISGNGVGVGVARQSFVLLRGATVVNYNSRDGMRLSYDAGATIFAGVFIRDNSGWAVFCNDTESSLDNRSGDNVEPIECSGFDQ
jgi:hypothetical protein